MRAVRKMLCVLMMVTMLCAMMANAAFAAENGNLWLRVEEPAEGDTVITVVADTTVTNGHVELRYDAAKLTYTGVTVSEEFVDVYAVNTDTPGVVEIAWVAPGEYTGQGEDALILVSFTGKVNTRKLSITGKAYNAAGAEVDLLSDIETDENFEDSADTGDNILPVMGLMLLSVTAMAVCLVSNRKEWWAK